MRLFECSGQGAVDEVGGVLRRLRPVRGQLPGGRGRQHHAGRLHQHLVRAHRVQPPGAAGRVPGPGEDAHAGQPSGARRVPGPRLGRVAAPGTHGGGAQGHGAGRCIVV